MVHPDQWGYAIQHAAATLRRARGERCRGYKAGCLSPVIQRQLGLHEPVRGYVWASEAHDDGCRLRCADYENLASELARADIVVSFETGPFEAHKLAELPGGPLGSVRWLAAALAQAGEPLQAGDIVLTGSPGSLIPIRAGHTVRVETGGMAVQSRFY